MRAVFYTLGGLMIVLGLMAVAGSANDCDGRCIENANTIGQMMFIVFWGLISVVLGSIIVAKTATH
tara:strand:+ start:727 stop:924 length:198 start_codon:yes stop_codon:yes gene_type:complete